MMTRPKYIFCSTATPEENYILFLIFSLCEDVFVKVNKDQSEEALERIKLYNNYEYDPLADFFNNVKLQDIELNLKKNGKSSYLEIDPTFMFSSAKVICDQLGREMAIIHFIRNIVDTSIKMCIQKKIPSNKYSHHVMNLRCKTNKIKPTFTKYREFRHVFFRALWHNLEYHVRTKDLISRHRNIKHKVFFSKWIDNKEEISSMVRFLGFKMNSQRIESASKVKKAYDEMSNYRDGNIIYNKMGIEEWTRVALRFINRFGNAFQLTKEECVQLTEI